MRLLSLLFFPAVFSLVLASPRAARAAEPPPEEADDGFERSIALLPWKTGPQPLELGHGVRLALPEGHRFLGQPEAGELMKNLGNLHNDDLLGVVLSTDPADAFLVSIRYDEEGFIRDDEKLDAKEILASIREGEAEYNEERKKLGFTAIHADGWHEEPRYDGAKHHVVWALIVSDATGSSVNLNTRVLGRKGFVSVNLVTDRALLDLHRSHGLAILGATSFAPGERYEDFDPAKDKVAEYGLTGLVLGGAGVGIAKAAKIGILAKAWKAILALLVAGKKGIGALFAAVAALAKKLFGKKRADAVVPDGAHVDDAGSEIPPA
jgi:uncharacterized membrane-anchored protein